MLRLRQSGYRTADGEDGWVLLLHTPSAIIGELIHPARAPCTEDGTAYGALAVRTMTVYAT